MRCALDKSREEFAQSCNKSNHNIHTHTWIYICVCIYVYSLYLGFVCKFFVASIISFLHRLLFYSLSLSLPLCLCWQLAAKCMLAFIYLCFTFWQFYFLLLAILKHILLSTLRKPSHKKIVVQVQITLRMRNIYLSV